MGEQHDGHLRPKESARNGRGRDEDGEPRVATNPPPRTCERIADEVVSWLRAAPPRLPDRSQWRE